MALIYLFSFVAIASAIGIVCVLIANYEKNVVPHCFAGNCYNFKRNKEKMKNFIVVKNQTNSNFYHINIKYIVSIYEIDELVAIETVNNVFCTIETKKNVLEKIQKCEVLDE